MDMLFLNISGGEFLIIATFILIFFGSKGIPEFARTFGRTIRQLRQATDQVKRDIENSARDVQHDFKKQMDGVVRKPFYAPEEKQDEAPQEDHSDSSATEKK